MVISIIPLVPPCAQYAPQIIPNAARGAGFATVMGPASFHIYKNNQFDLRQKGKPGRIPVVSILSWLSHVVYSTHIQTLVAAHRQAWTPS